MPGTYGTLGESAIAARVEEMGTRAEFFAWGWKIGSQEPAPMSQDFGMAYRERYAAYLAGTAHGHPSIDVAWDEYRKTRKVT